MSVTPAVQLPTEVEGRWLAIDLSKEVWAKERRAVIAVGTWRNRKGGYCRCSLPTPAGGTCLMPN